MRKLTLVIGIACLVEASIRTYLVFNVHVANFLKISPLVHYGLVGAIVPWVITSERRMFETTGSYPFAVE